MGPRRNEPAPAGATTPAFTAPQARPPDRAVQGDGGTAGEQKTDLADRFARVAGVRPVLVDSDEPYLDSLGPWSRRLAIGLTFLVIFVAVLMIAMQVLG